MLRNVRIAALAVLALVTAACNDDDDGGPAEPTTFTVLIENLSAANTLPVARLNGVVPLSPGVFAVTDGTNPLFAVGGAADVGMERLSEDGNNAVKAAALDLVTNLQNGVFSAPGGADAAPTIGPGESATFTITASPGDRFHFATMFSQSNDWFYGFGASGLDLFDDDDDPISGNMTSQLVLYDAGTEEDTSPGTGADQAPVQVAANTGAVDNVTTIRLASTNPFTIPATASVIRITITPQQ